MKLGQVYLEVIERPRASASTNQEDESKDNFSEKSCEDTLTRITSIYVFYDVGHIYVVLDGSSGNTWF